MGKKKNILDYLLNLDFVISGIAFTILVLVTFSGVFMRYFISKPFIWQEEVQLATIVWIVFLGAGAAFRLGSHVAIEIIVDSLPKTLRQVVEFLGYLVVIIVLLYLAKQGMTLVAQLAATQRTTNILSIPYEYIYSALPVGCALMIINYTIVMFRSIFSKETKTLVKGGAE